MNKHFRRIIDLLERLNKGLDKHICTVFVEIHGDCSGSFIFKYEGELVGDAEFKVEDRELKIKSFDEQNWKKEIEVILKELNEKLKQ